MTLESGKSQMHKDFILMKPSVIASNYNHGHFINEQIESIVNQA